jgi:uncharacterized glyoxalase superfamily protein PhnB
MAEARLKLNIENIRRQYAEMSDDALLEMEREDLVEQARQCYDEELGKRGLTLLPEDEEAFDSEHLEVVGNYNSSHEAEEARNALRAAGLRAYLGDDLPGEAGQTLSTAFRGVPVLAPVSELEAARGVLEALHAGESAAAPIGDSGYIRHGVGAVRAYLYGKLDLVEFVQQVFGGLELERHEFSATAFHVEVMIGDSVIAMEVSDPPHAKATPGSIYVYVPDVDDAYERALEAGGTSHAEPEDKPYDERTGAIKDSFGNTWWISTYTGA